MMPVTYVTENGELIAPDDSKEPLHEYHDNIESLVNASVVGLTGYGAQIRRIVLSDNVDVSELEEWLGASLSIESLQDD